jgi:hypothetical protein
MRYSLTVIAFFLLISSCNSGKKNEVIGYWRLNYHDKIENIFIPFEIHFYGDSLKLVDRYNYCQTGHFTRFQDSLNILFSNGSNSIVSLQIVSDSVIRFANETYYRIGYDEFTKIPHYELFGFVTDKLLKESSHNSVIHLIEVDGKPKAILNDVITDLKYIPDYLKAGHYSPRSLLLYIGKGISFEDLVEAYNWILVSGVQKTTLVLANDGFDKFFIQNDKISISDILKMEFQQNNRILPSPPLPESVDDIQWKIIRIENLNQLSNLELLNDSTNYLIQIDNVININDYLKLKGLIENKKNIKTEIKRLTTLYKEH